MVRYYGIGYTEKENKMVLIDLPTSVTTRQQATKEIEIHCKRNELRFGGVFFDKNTQKQGGTNTKFARYRKANNGKNPPDYFGVI